MRKALFGIVIIKLFSLLTGCSCSGGDENIGIITGSIDVDCFPISGTEFIILDDSSFKNFFPDTTCSLPIIDFNQYSLLGLYTDGGCNMKCVREVTREESESKYNYKVIVKDCGICKKLVLSYNWVTVPKLPTGWGVSFEIERK